MTMHIISETIVKLLPSSLLKLWTKIRSETLSRISFADHLQRKAEFLRSTLHYVVFHCPTFLSCKRSLLMTVQTLLTPCSCIVACQIRIRQNKQVMLFQVIKEISNHSWCPCFLPILARHPFLPASCLGSKETMENTTSKSTKNERKKQHASAMAGQTKFHTEKGQGTSKTNENKDEGSAQQSEAYPSKVVAMHRVRWNMNRGSERWLCYGGAAGIVRCQQVSLPMMQLGFT